jgi:hypothetical protein
VETWELSVTAAIPKDDKRDWGALEGAKVTVYPVGDEGNRTSYLDCFSIDDGEDYSTDNEGRVKVSLVALDKAEE